MFRIIKFCVLCCFVLLASEWVVRTDVTLSRQVREQSLESWCLDLPCGQDTRTGSTLYVFVRSFNEFM